MPSPSSDPFARFAVWLAEASAHPAVAEPTAMSLATATLQGIPSVRMVLLKGVDARGFVFYTNAESRKGGELAANPHAALCLFWQPLGRQVRVEGPVEQVTDAEADAYFASRHPTSRRGAWASAQSRPLDARETLEARLREVEARYPDDDTIPRPPHWKGWRVLPKRIEFWQEGAFRLHDREVYARDGDGWRVLRLNP